MSSHYTSTQFQSDIKVEKLSLPSYDSVMKLTSMGYTRDQAVHSLACSGGKVYEAADWLLSRTVHHDVAMRKKPTLSEAQFQTQWTEQPSFRPSNESVIEMMSLGFTKEQAIDVLKCSDGNEEEAAIRLVNHPVHSDVTVQEKVAFLEEEEKIKDSDFVEIQDSDEEKQDSDEEIKELDKDIIADFSESITDLSPGDINGKTSKETINVSCLNRNR